MTPNSIAPVARKLFRAMPMLARKDMLFEKASDKSIRRFLEIAGAPKFTPDLEAAFASGFADAAGAVAIGREKFLMAPDPYFGAMHGEGPPATGGPSPRTTQVVSRYPFALYSQTALADAANVVANANSQNYFNGTPYEFVVTHVGMSQDVNPISFLPNYLLQISPAQSGKNWSRIPVPAKSTLTYQGSGSPNPEFVRWHLPAAYLLNRNGSFLCTSDNNSNGTITSGITFIAYKNDGIGTPRIFFDSQSLGAGVVMLPFNSTNLQNDGDADAMITDVIFNAGNTGNWTGGNDTAPTVFISPNGNTGATFAWTGIGQNGTLATCLNNTFGALGPYWELVTPYRIAPGTGINVAFQTQSGGGTNSLANLAFSGYLEVRQ